MINPYFLSGLALIPIITIHELGHLFAAKAVGCKVDVFSIGFGRPIFSFHYKNTRYNFGWLLLGGYIKVKAELEPSEESDAFSNLPFKKKALLISAGCINNIITGFGFILLGSGLKNYTLFYFGYLSIIMGILNLLPLAPCLDGGYLTYLPFFLKMFGKEKGWKIFRKSSRISFVILMGINLACIPWIIWMIMKGI